MCSECSFSSAAASAALLMLAPAKSATAPPQPSSVASAVAVNSTKAMTIDSLLPLLEKVACVGAPFGPSFLSTQPNQTNSSSSSSSYFSFHLTELPIHCSSRFNFGSLFGQRFFANRLKFNYRFLLNGDDDDAAPSVGFFPTGEIVGRRNEQSGAGGRAAAAMNTTGKRLALSLSLT